MRHNVPPSPTRRARDAGNVLPMVLVISVVLSVLVAGLAGYVTTGLRYGSIVEERADRLAAADGGMRYAVERLKLGVSRICATAGGDTIDPPDTNGATVTVTCGQVGSGFDDTNGWAMVLTGEEAPAAGNSLVGPGLTVCRKVATDQPLMASKIERGALRWVQSGSGREHARRGSLRTPRGVLVQELVQGSSGVEAVGAGEFSAVDVRDSVQRLLSGTATAVLSSLVGLIGAFMAARPVAWLFCRCLPLQVAEELPESLEETVERLAEGMGRMDKVVRAVTRSLEPVPLDTLVVRPPWSGAVTESTMPAKAVAANTELPTDSPGKLSLTSVPPLAAKNRLMPTTVNSDGSVTILLPTPTSLTVVPSLLNSSRVCEPLSALKYASPS